MNQEKYNEELKKLNELFVNVDEDKKKLAEGLVQDAAFLFAENYDLKQLLNKTGMVKVHPEHPELQKTVLAAEQYRKNLNAYAPVIKVLSAIMDRKIDDDNDDMEEFE